MFNVTKLLMTCFICPIQPSFKFFGGINFDNPRTDEEINYVVNLLKKEIILNY